jgi:hypothetical protein
VLVTHFAPGFGNYGVARALSRSPHELDASMRGYRPGPRFSFAGRVPSRLLPAPRIASSTAGGSDPGRTRSKRGLTKSAWPTHDSRR